MGTMGSRRDRRRRFRTSARLWPLLAAALVALAGCGDDGVGPRQPGDDGVGPEQPGSGEQPGDDGAGPEEPFRIVVLGGDKQTGTVGTTLAEPLRIQVRQGGSPVQGAEVVWSFPGDEELRDSTDQEGMSSAWWTLGTQAGEKHAWARLGEISDSGYWQFSATAMPGPAVTMRGPGGWLQAAYPQVGVVGTPLPFDYYVEETDAYGNAASPGIPVEWTITQGGGHVEEMPPPNPWWGSSWSWARLTLGPAEEVVRVTATAPDLPTAVPVTFEATAVGAVVAVDQVTSVYLPEWATTITVAAFVPGDVSVTAGQSVGWLWATWYDPEYDWEPSLHDLVFEDEPTAPTSSEAMRFGSRVRTFSKPGTYRYRCTLHSVDFEEGHVGVVTVLPS